MKMPDPDNGFSRWMDADRKDGIIPRIIEEMSPSPAAANAYLVGQHALSDTRLTHLEKCIVAFVCSLENGCKYCYIPPLAMLTRYGFLDEELERIRHGEPFKMPWHQQLSLLTKTILEKRSHLTPTVLEPFEAAGVGKDRIIEMITQICFAEIHIYITHLTHHSLIMAELEDTLRVTTQNPSVDSKAGSPTLPSPKGGGSKEGFPERGG